MSEGLEGDDLRLEEGDLCVAVMCGPVIVCTLMVEEEEEEEERSRPRSMSFSSEGQKNPCGLCCRE